MKNRDIIRTIKKEAKSLVPDMKAEIISSLPFSQPQKQKRETPKFYKKPVFAVAVIVLCVAVALLMTYIFYNPQKIAEISDSYVSIDINPSIELTADKNDIVKAIRPMNADAAILIFGEVFDGMSVENACVKIVGLATEMGYISDSGENAIKIVGINDNQQHETALSNKISKKVQTYLTENSISANVSASGNASKKLQKAAKKNGVTVGKMQLLNELREKDPALDFEQAKKKSVKELNQLLKNYDEDSVEDVLTDLENEYEQIEQENQAELEQEITAIENKYSAITAAIENLLSLADGDFSTLETAVIDFNNAYPEHKFPVDISAQSIDQIIKHFENLLEKVQSTINKEKKETQDNAQKEARQQTKNKWKNQNNSHSNKNK